MALGDLLFPKIEMKLIITHDFMADIEAVRNKFSDEYVKHTALVRLSKGDMQKLSLKDGSNVSIESPIGKVVVRAVMDENGKDGLAVMIHGPWALALVDVPSDGAPPKLHGVQVTIKKTDDVVTSLSDLFSSS